MFDGRGRLARSTPCTRRTFLPFGLRVAIAATHDRLIMLRLLYAISLNFFPWSAEALGLFCPLGCLHHLAWRRHALLLSRRFPQTAHNRGDPLNLQPGHRPILPINFLELEVDERIIARTRKRDNRHEQEQYRRYCLGDAIHNERSFVTLRRIKQGAM